jgi:NADH-quinone oxidoreductase subunit L
MNLEFVPWLILLLPLAAAGAVTLFTLGDARRSGALSVGAVLAALGLAVAFISLNGWQPSPAETTVTWLSVGNLEVDLGLRLDPLSLLMVLVVTGVGGAIHVYSLGYMRDDPGYARYFACLSLFTFSMLGIVLANNFVMMFMCWELVGVSSYLLIGFWFERPSAADAAKKAFLTNRVGDFGFILGIILAWFTLGSVHFGTLEEHLKRDPAALGGLATVAGLLIFCGAAGKSAQFPLHVWLPDAMEGPTPVSALIHAATMVAAGVYMLCRVFFLLDLPGSQALDVVAWVGGLTALLAALMAVQQNDIKRILAYSTLSQLGYMVLAVGVAAPTSAMFHLTTHAFFKALLFLGAGSVILALHHEQDIWRMGGLRRKMPVTFWTFLLGTLALCGVPPLSGFFSKDEILAAAWGGGHGSPALFGLAAVVAVLTTFYMFRLFLVAFAGERRSEAAAQAKESSAVMTGPLVVLAGLSVAGGFLGLATVYGRQLGEAHAGSATVAMVTSLIAVAVGLGLAWALYRRAAEDPLPRLLGGVASLLRHRFYLDELYEATVIRLQDTMALVADWLDRWVVAGLLVRGLHGTTELTGRALRLLQTGNLQTYAFLLVLGVAVLLYFMIGR